jgi:hypothetical protein
VVILSQKELANELFELEKLDIIFEKWYREEDSLNAFTNNRLTT